ncbi:MAG: hypothetical protein OH316_02490 [Candidatus Parvarchaeota archaeon]|nr:hypothetical protein [Candidatus Parvarchaeota archaeon]MCW1301978.1 hypothetical protein [Candidatus Parvarchaeota archaeon]
MNIEIGAEKENKFLGRRTIEFVVNFERKETVKLLDVRKELLSRYPSGFLVVYTLRNTFGLRRMKGVAHIYSDEATARAVLPDYILKKNGLMEDAKEKEKK